MLKALFGLLLIGFALCAADTIPPPSPAMEDEVIPMDTLTEPGFSPKYSLDINGGFSFASMTGSDIENIETMYGTVVTSRMTGDFLALFTYYFNHHLSLSGGMGYVCRGFEAQLASAGGTDMSTGSPVTIDAKLFRTLEVNFLEFPVMATLHSANFTYPFNLFCSFGLSLGKAKSSKERIYETIEKTEMSGDKESEENDLLVTNLMEDRTITDDSTGASIHYHYDDFYSNYDVSFVFGVGVERIFHNRVGLYFALRYFRGLLNYNNLSDRATAELQAYYGHAVTISQTVEAFFRTTTTNMGIRIYF